MQLVYIFYFSGDDHVPYLDSWNCDSGRRLSRSTGLPLHIDGGIPGDFYLPCVCGIFKSSQGGIQKVVERQSDEI